MLHNRISYLFENTSIWSSYLNELSRVFYFIRKYVAWVHKPPKLSSFELNHEIKHLKLIFCFNEVGEPIYVYIDERYSTLLTRPEKGALMNERVNVGRGETEAHIRRLGTYIVLLSSNA